MVSAVSGREIPCSGEPGDFGASLKRVVDQFGTNPKSLQILAALARQFPEAFMESAARLLEAGDDSAGYRCMTALLSQQPELPEFLTDSKRFSLANAVELFRKIRAVDRTLDFRLARRLPRGKVAANGRVLTGLRAVRAIDILDQVSEGQRLMSLMGRLPYNGDPRIASRAALFVGRRVGRCGWMKNQLNQEDPRLRANVVESAWGSTAADTLCLLEQCCEDENNRVAGNALIGLHLAGSGVLEKTLDLSFAETPERRVTAAWVMGRTRLTGFVIRLKELLRDESPKVRRAALLALAEIRRAEIERSADVIEEKALAGLAEKPHPIQTDCAVPEDGIGEDSFAPRLDGSFRGRDV